MQLKGGGTIFAKMSGAPRNDTDYMISVNAKLTGTKWYIDTKNLSNDTIIESIRFEDLKHYPERNLNQSSRCIIVGGSAIFRNLTWTNFKQGIKWAEGYADARKIEQCNVSNFFSKNADEEINPTNFIEIFFFDLNSNGDGTVVEQCGVCSNPYGSLRVGNCSGASIHDNVLNAPVSIRNAKAVSFHSNHMENSGKYYADYDNKLIIYSSTVYLSSNYFEKGKEPCIIINETKDANVSNITATDNAFVAIGGKRESDDSFTSTQDRINSMSDYDISFNSFTNLILTNNYRYDIPQIALAGNSHTLGIQLQTITVKNEVLNKEPFEVFNNKSYLLSQYCQIMGLKVINIPLDISNTKNDYMGYCGLNSNCKWLYNPGTYNYKYSFLTETADPSTATLKNLSPNFVIGSEQFASGVLLQVF